MIASDTTQTYHVAVVGFLGAGLVLSSSAVNGLVYSNIPAREADAAGMILLSMVTVRTPLSSLHHESSRLGMNLALCSVDFALLTIYFTNSDNLDLLFRLGAIRCPSCLH